MYSTYPSVSAVTKLLKELKFVSCQPVCTVSCATVSSSVVDDSTDQHVMFFLPYITVSCSMFDSAVDSLPALHMLQT